jgi:hypothetical protein
MRQSGHTADHENGKDHGAAGEKPGGNLSAGSAVIHGRFRGNKKEANYRLFRLSAPCDNAPHPAATLCRKPTASVRRTIGRKRLCWKASEFLMWINSPTHQTQVSFPALCPSAVKDFIFAIHSAPRAPNNDGG